MLVAAARGEDAAEAAQHFAEVVKSGRGEAVSAEVAQAVATAQLSLADQKTEAFFEAPPPADLDFSQESGAQRLQKWLLGAMDAVTDAREAYLAVVGNQQAPAVATIAAIAAIARVGDVTVRMSDMLLEMPVPPTVVSAGPEAIDAYCDELDHCRQPR